MRWLTNATDEWPLASYAVTLGLTALIAIAALIFLGPTQPIYSDGYAPLQQETSP